MIKPLWIYLQRENNQEESMRYLTQRRNKSNKMQPRNSIWNVHLFVKVTGRDMSGLLKNCKMTTIRGMTTATNT